MAKLTVKKYKTYFTIAEIQSLRDDTRNILMKKYLSKRLRMIDAGDILSEFSVDESDAVQLGFAAPTDKSTEPERIRKEQERRYISNEMSAAEEKEYEISIGVPQS